MKKHLIRSSTIVDESALLHVATMLHLQWPSGGSIESRLIKLKNPEQQSYILFEEQQAVGHVEIKAASQICSDSVGIGSHCIAVSVIVQRNSRRRGYGTALMELLENEAARLGYSYIYLWTDDAIQFYQKLGYLECDSVNSDVAALRTLNETSVQSLENLFLRRLNLQTRSTQSSNGSSFVWLRKRLVFGVSPPVFRTKDELRAEIEEQLSREIERLVRLEVEKIAPNSVTISPCVISPKTDYSLHLEFTPLPHHRQIGPTCGIAAATMINTLMEDISHKSQRKGPVEKEDSSLRIKRREGGEGKMEDKIDDVTRGVESKDQRTIERRLKDREGGGVCGNEFFSLALSQGMSVDGEMFVLEDMIVLLREVWGLREEEEEEEKENKEEVRSEGCRSLVKECSILDLDPLLNGSPVPFSSSPSSASLTDLLTQPNTFLLFPYDRAPSSLSPPICNQGKSAHYSVLCGSAVVEGNFSLSWREEEVGGDQPTDTLIPDPDFINKQTEPVLTFPFRLEFLIGFQGLSIKPVVALESEWLQSNAQLSINTKYQMREGGMQLRGRCILIR